MTAPSVHDTCQSPGFARRCQRCAFQSGVKEIRAEVPLRGLDGDWSSLHSVLRKMPRLFDIHLRLRDNADVKEVKSVAGLRLNNRLRVARAEKNLSQGELAELVGVTRQTISSIETGQYCPSALLALHLAVKLGKRFDDLFYLEEVSP